MTDRKPAADADFAGHPHGEWASFDDVPPEVALAYDLANSRDERMFHPHSEREDGRDLLSSTADLEEWFRYRGYEVGVTDEDLALTRRVREAVRLAARAHVQPAARDEARTAIADVAGAVPLRAVMDDEGELRVQGAAEGVPGILGSLLGKAVDASCREAWSRLKMCAADDCRWVFFDRSKPRTGRWCEMAVCGNRVKAREYRRRRAS